MTGLLTSWLITYAMHSTVLLGLVALVDGTLRRRVPHLQELAWKAALLGAVFSSALQAGGLAPQRFEIFALPPVMLSEQGGNAAVPLLENRAPRADGSASLTPRPQSAVLAPVAPPALGLVKEAPLPSVLLGLWLLGAAAMLARLQVIAFRLRLLLSRRRPYPLAHERFGVPSWVQVSICEHVSQPMAVGRRQLVLPPRVATLAPAQIQAVLAHELAHLKRGDGVWRWICLVTQSVLFFQPLNYLASRRIAQAAERGSDALALEQGASRASLVDAITGFALPGHSTPALASGIMSRPHELVGRVEALVRRRTRKGPGLKVLLGVLCVLTALAAVGLPGVSSGAQKTKRGTVVDITDERDGFTEISVSHSDDGIQLRLKAKGHFEINPAEDALTFLDGHFDLTHVGETSRRVRFEGDGKSVETEFWLDGRRQPYDAPAQAWFASILPQLLRVSGIDAEARAARLYARGGSAAVLAEIKKIRSDLSQRRYFASLFKQEDLSTADLVSALDVAGDTLRGDLEKRLALRATLHRVDDDPVGEAYIRAAQTLGSDLEHRLALEALLKNRDLPAALERLALDSADSIGSDLEQRLLLQNLIAQTTAEANVLTLIDRAGDSIRSDLELRLLLSEVARLHGSDRVNDALVAAARDHIGSGLERDLLLRELKER
ncbi:MAG: M56 family metallopeptidase [Pseudomonadota bacterium]